MLVTIGITTYRRLTYLREAVDSALNQDFDDFEILISQNPHPDEAVRTEVQEWCLRKAEQHPRIRYQMNDRNLGVAGNMNAIADAARGEFLIFIGDDDRLLRDGVSRLGQHVADDVDVVFGNHKVINAEGKEDVALTDKMEARFGRKAIRPGILSAQEAEFAAWNVSVAIAASIVRTEVFRKFKLRPHLTKGDTELYIRMASAGVRFLFCPQQVSEIRYHDDRATVSIVGFGDLALSLLNVPVTPSIEEKRRTALSEMTRQGVTDLLLHGRVSESRLLMASPFFRRFKIKNMLQVLCGQILPASVGLPMFRSIYRIYSRTDLVELSRLGQETLSNSGQPVA
ncbi:MAG: glycosyltransferase family 2 protein [Rhodothermales bacterium]